MKNLFYPLLMATAFVATACTNNQEDGVTPVDPNGKTPISFVGETVNTAITRAGFADNTLIAMHIRSTYAKDDKEETIRETRTWAIAKKDASQSANSYSDILAPSDENVRYWDDAFGRDAQLSVFAVAVPKASAPENNGVTLANLLGGSASWSTGKLSEGIKWMVSPDQSGSTTISDEDLTYSNNISKDGEGGVVSSNTTDKNGYLKFRLNSGSPTDGPGTFDQGNLKFTHALSRITVNLVKGTGFEKSSFDFTADTDGTVTNVKILNVPTSGSLNIETGAWTNDASTSGITKMAPLTISEGSTYSHSLLAQVLPGYTFNKGSNTDVLEFFIDNNKYTVSQDMMLTALNNGQNTSENSITMKQGNNYIFTITVNKKKIEVVSASVVDFEKIYGELALDNHHYTFDLFNGGTEITEKLFTFYRYQDATVTGIQTSESKSIAWDGNYTASTDFAYDTDKKMWGTEWYYEDNTKFYHFRTTSSANVTPNYHVATSGSDYFTMSSGPVSKDPAKGTDYIWGAPIKAIEGLTTPLPYDLDNGYSSYINPAIGATDTDIRMTQMHMMANINIVLVTPEKPTSTNNSILLYDVGNKKGSTIALTNFYTQGNVSMGNGKITLIDESLNTDATGQLISAPSVEKATDFYKTLDTKTNEFSYSVIPQALVENDHKVGLLITTPDNNQYYVVNDLSTIKDSKTGKAIARWYPGHQYNYTIKLTKTGIVIISCSVVGWENVEAEPTNISLEN